MGQPGGARRTALAVLAVAGAAGISLLRQTGAGALDTVYAEDGTIFLSSAYSESTVDSVTTPYAGYLHFAPRLLAALVSAFPVPWAASVLSIAAAVVTGLMALLVYFASQRLGSIPARLLVSAVVVLVPVGQDELPNSIANLHWPALYTLFWVLVWRPVSRLTQTIAAISVLLIALSDLLVLVYVPLALWLWWRRRDRHSFVLTGALGLGLAVQAATVLFGPGGRELHFEPVKWLPWWGIRAVPVSVLGQTWFPSDVDTRWLMLAVVAWVVLAAFVVMAFLRGRKADRREWTAQWQLAALAGVYCVAVYALPVMLSGQATPRYAAAPAMLLVTVLVALIARPGLPVITVRTSSALAADPSDSLVAVGSAASQSHTFGAPADAAPASEENSAASQRRPAGTAGDADASSGAVDKAALPLGAASPATAGAGHDRYLASAGDAAPSRNGGGWVSRGVGDAGRDSGAVAGMGRLRAKQGVAFAALGVFLVAVWVANLRVPNERSDGPSWTGEVARACADGSEVRLSPPPWTMKVPCEEVAAWR